MPGDLKDPEQLYPYHYETKYEPGINQFDTSLDENAYLQTLVDDMGGGKLSPTTMKALRGTLEGKGVMCRHWDDPKLRDEIKRFIEAQKVVAKWLKLTN